MFVLLFLFWIIFNGKATQEVLIIGACLVAVIEWFMVRYMDYSIKNTVAAACNIGKIVVYVLQLISEIIQSNIKVIEIIVNTKREIKPKIISFETTLDSNMKKSVLGNSITLTPGTITAFIEDKRVTVVCLDEEFAEGIDDTVFERKLRKMKGAKK
ncbi:MAG: Na+/H+ antiporter subunit E [bacterium]|nr:Na+/H+ antiporter subunit E [bacterium]